MKIVESIRLALLGQSGDEARDAAVSLAVSIISRTKIVSCSDEEVELIVQCVQNKSAC